MIKTKILGLLDRKISLFTFAFILMAIYLFPHKDLISASQDAVETWQVVKTFLDPDPYHSYIMYKGFLAIIPNLIFYQLSVLLHFDQFFFLKLFNSFGFAYMVTVGIPYFFSFLFEKKLENYKIYILTIILFFGIRENFSFLSIDVSSIIVLLLTVNSVIRINNAKSRLPMIYYLYTGIIFAMCLSFSGQYLPGAVFAMLFLLFSKLIPIVKKKQIHFRFIIIVLCFTLGFSVINITNSYFVETRVQPVRDAGEWLPTGEEWLKFALTNNMLMSKHNPYIPDNRGEAILILEGADIHSIELGGGSYGFKEYVKLVFSYPLDFIVRWLNRLFLGISIDNVGLKNSEPHISYLFVSYSLLFLSLLTMIKHCDRVKRFLDIRTFLVFALIIPSLVPCTMHVEMRYFMSIQILIAGTALLSDTLWKPVKDLIKSAKKMKTNTRFQIGEIKISNVFMSYIIFMTLCILLIATQYELMGPDLPILFSK
ncbi:hypothetical protein AT727_02540 [Desulfitobacterium hafniense]|uniref:Glycosyltransferase RgtA/B/C/D-like domain-containing protein n=1 Tax=Desulfitobacterium hafniense TaxID=49338 RepID=A0A0W1JQQ3_DESHA|nr:hypothetical protein [Desulfitobacterium hafniense]KTE93853.1 hypothetical protein AT727_02540 [Desulfitobacterium hafniense]